MAINKSLTPPPSTEKIGKKINFIISHVHENCLRELGFSKSARNLFRAQNNDGSEIIQILNFQGNKWNEGSKGSFCINLGISFTEIKKLIVEIPYYEYLKPMIHDADVSICEMSIRIDDIMPEAKENWWPKPLEKNRDSWFEIDDDTDLVHLSDSLQKIFTTYLMPWYEASSNYDFICDTPASFLTRTTFPQRIAAAILLGQQRKAQDILDEYIQNGKKSDVMIDTIAWANSKGIQNSIKVDM